MSASGPPLCRVCLREHWSREPHILPANAPAEIRAKRKMIQNNVKTSSAIKTGDPHILTANAPAEKRSARPDTSADEAKDRKVGNARRDSSADCSSSRFTAQASGTLAKNTSREGRRVLKAEAARPDATRTAATAKPNPPTPPGSDLGALPENQTKAAKVTPGKRKTAPMAKIVNKALRTLGNVEIPKLRKTKRKGKKKCK